MGHWALGSQCVARVSRVEATGVIGHGEERFSGLVVGFHRD